MKEPTRKSRVGSRWPGALAILAVLILLAALPGRIKLFPTWLAYGVGVVVLTPMVAVALTSAEARWLRVERGVTLLFAGAMAAGPWRTCST